MGTHRDMIVVGASQGGVEALGALLAQLPADLDAAVLVVLHTSPRRESLLASILSRHCTLPVGDARDQENWRPGRIYLAPPNQHLVVYKDILRTWQGPRENRSRPAIDPLFRSAAVTRRNRVIGVILTGTLDDGAAGLRALKNCGAVTVVQDPADAAHPEMPQHAIRASTVDHVVALRSMGELLVRLTQETPPPSPALPAEMVREVELMYRAMGIQNHERNIEDTEEIGNLVPITCPECGGPLWKVGEDDRFRCHVGHAYSVHSLLAEQDRGLEQALWAAVRTLEERNKMLQDLSDRETGRGQADLAERFTERAQESRRYAERLRQLLLTTPPSTPDPIS